MKNYIMQAENFCKEFNVTVEIKYLYCGKYFSDDKQNRNIYSVNISRNGKNWDFKFGDSIYNTEKKKKPSVYDILATITKHEVSNNFDEFISEFGYEMKTEKDYIDFKKIHMDCLAEYKNVLNMFGDCMDELQEIQ